MGLKTFVKGNGAFIIIWLQTKFGPKIVLSFFLMAPATATVLHTSSTSFPGGKDKRGILGQICAPLQTALKAATLVAPLLLQPC